MFQYSVLGSGLGPFGGRSLQRPGAHFRCDNLPDLATAEKGNRTGEGRGGVPAAFSVQACADLMASVPVVGPPDAHAPSGAARPCPPWPLPQREWGHPSCFFWAPHRWSFYCRLCWKYVDQKHADSYWHLKYARAGEYSRRLQHVCPLENAGKSLVGYTIDRGVLCYRVSYSSGVPFSNVVYQF